MPTETLEREPEAKSEFEVPEVFETLTDEECALIAILQDRSGLDIAEFLFTNPSTANPPDDCDGPGCKSRLHHLLHRLHGCWRALPHQWSWWRVTNPGEKDMQVDQGARAIGKALALDTPVETIDGPKTIGTLEVGDEVFDELGRPTEVIDLAEILHDRRCLELEFSDGARIVADADHQWPTPDGPKTSAELGETISTNSRALISHDSRTVVAVRDVPSRPVRCITVAAESRVFLAGPTSIPTYNSESIIARMFAHLFNMPGQEMVLVAPEGKHLDTLTERMEARLKDSRLMTEMIEKRGGMIATHKPFRVRARNGAQVYSATPGKKGTGVKGIHPAALEVDEAQDLPDAVWKELPSTVEWRVPGSYWRCHGVSNGVRNTFYNITENDPDWLVHQVTALHSVLYNGEYSRGPGARIYGGYRSPDFRRNVWGEHGDAMNRIFVLSRLMAATDIDDLSDYNRNLYLKVQLTPEMILSRVGDLHASIDVADDAQVAAMMDLVQLPQAHLNPDWNYWVGQDIGLVGDPSEIIVAAERHLDPRERQANKRAQLAVPAPGQSIFQVLTRINLLQIPTPLQVELIMHIVNHYRPRAYALDITGSGLPIFQLLQQRAGTSRLYVPDSPELPDPQAGEALTVLKGYKFGEKIVVAIDEERASKLEGELSPAEILEKAGIKRIAKDQATDLLREVVDNGRWRMPHDMDFINQMNGAAMANAPEPMDAYGRRRMVYNQGVFHLLDGARMLILGHFQAPLEEMANQPTEPQKPVIVQFMGRNW